MAKRYGGKFSPDGQSENDKIEARGTFDGARVDPAGARTNILFIPAIPLVFMSLGDGAIGLTLALVAAAVLTLAAWLVREGLRAEAAYNARKVARRPAFPRKMAASLLTGVGIALAAFKSEPGLVAPILYGGVATVLHGFAFGLDPLRDKGMEGVDTFQQDRVARVIDEAESRLSEMSDAVKRAGDRKIETRVDQFQATARDLFRTVEEDPRDLTSARKYLTVYLQGARDATIKYADIHARSRDVQAREDYLALLDDLEQNFAARTRKMLLDDRSDLTVEIEVLRERLQREGVRTDAP
ncbi:5-bromo-4-chloroindolyl phosphate hydrolysis family protein [Sedimentitalea todarodis]|uniref:5-bromo-4-chloroindolyl phosphate hydrolysis family protein n=1 Tax=Sedimentitalea todarodis TaxID=1631240 RepID=A0ABU3V8P4_9RHOB|nr:5-bromo-4-chloroindolyl phosphate hydrolysis family protein [Sedimentitalea todarodis]MDU9002537.1 5-bromo-4-chloroindolyl phosphate hydrolysis family protein [Sedimentitalea todarodis]